MQNSLWERIIDVLLLRRLQSRWRKLAGFCAVVVVFITTYMLILPAITVTTDTFCGTEEHLHLESCYDFVPDLTCELDHEHDDDCYNLRKTLICTKAEHLHDGRCYEAEHSIATTLPYSEENTSSDSETDETTSSDVTAGEETTAGTTDSAQGTTAEGDTTTLPEDTATTEETTVAEETTKVSEETTQEETTQEETTVPEESDHLKGLNEEDEQAVLRVIDLIDALPDDEKFFEKALLLYGEDEMTGQAYYNDIQNRAVSAYCSYQGLEERLWQYVENFSKLQNLLLVFEMQTFEVVPDTDAIDVGYVNKGWSTIAPVIVHGGSASTKITSGSKPNRYWYSLVIEYDNDKQAYYVSEKVYNTSASDNSAVLSLSATTAKGFVLFVWCADSGATSTQKAAANIAANANVGDYVLVSPEPTTISSGGYTANLVSVQFGDYVEPEPEIPEQHIPFDITTDDPTPGEPSDTQIRNMGGKVISANEEVEISKSIDGTELENVFDITLTVKTKTNVQFFKEESGVDIVVVMDISNTMNTAYGDTTRYYAAVEAAENFINNLAAENFGKSRVGFVAFNTHAHEIFPLSSCTNETEAAALISTMKTKTADIVRASGYASDRERFTNVEGGLKRGYDMLSSSTTSNSYIVFLSDGFPTTYLDRTQTNYKGYEPFSTGGTKGADGVFYNAIAGVYSSGGTNYSEKGAVRAREQATIIKESGTKIFSIGVDVGGHTILKYYNGAYSTVDTMYTSINATFEIGKADDTQGYKNWLRDSIGSGYYYDSTNKTELESAFDNIFEEIKNLYTYNIKTIWAATDPMPVQDDGLRVVEFIHFYDKSGNATIPQQSVSGSYTEGGENTATHESDSIYWDLKNSGYTTTVDGDTTYYNYALKYRVRLKNELKVGTKGFSDRVIYETNGDAKLDYKTITTVNGKETPSEVKTVVFDKPSVRGDLGELVFGKRSGMDSPLEGAEFTLVHDVANCSVCRGDGTAVSLPNYTATSDADGDVMFYNIPSGHKYYMVETKVPEGYNPARVNRYDVTIAYNVITVEEVKPDGTRKVWETDDDRVVYNYGYILPETGGIGTYPLYIIGGLLVTLSTVFSICYKTGRGRRRKRSKL